MLLKMDVVRAVVAGELAFVYRRWAAPRAKVGGRQRTPLGELEVTSVEAVEHLREADGARAGMSLGDLEAALAQRSGTIYRIGLRYRGEDPRVALRSSLEGLDDVRARLARKDRKEPWTRSVLACIGANEGVVSTELAARLGMERATFKRRVRQLKELGLTESLEVGYRLSPRGKAVLGLEGSERKG